MALLAMNPGPLHAVTLGEIELRSALGEPLDAVIPIQLGRGEMLMPNCITAPRRTSDLKGPKDPRVRFPNAQGPGIYELRISTVAPLFEPVYELALKVNCSGTPQLIREYVLMPDLSRPPVPAGSRGAAADRAILPAAARSESVNRPPKFRNVQRKLAATGQGIPAGSMYRVRQGDSLSAIASRIESRPVDSTWKLANIIFRMNPDAFIRGNPDLIKLGSTIRLPDATHWSAAVAPLDRSAASRKAIPKNLATSPVDAETAIGPEQDAPTTAKNVATETRAEPVRWSYIKKSAKVPTES
ncbi:hypothetical protein ES703_40423 [subsurface metagenome]